VQQTKYKKQNVEGIFSEKVYLALSVRVKPFAFIIGSEEQGNITGRPLK
jgi:hypothetical protein